MSMLILLSGQLNLLSHFSALCYIIAIYLLYFPKKFHEYFLGAPPKLAQAQAPGTLCTSTGTRYPPPAERWLLLGEARLGTD